MFTENGHIRRVYPTRRLIIRSDLWVQKLHITKLYTQVCVTKLITFFGVARLLHVLPLKTESVIVLRCR